MKLHLVCTANICRSAYAELTTRHVLGPSSPGRCRALRELRSAFRPAEPADDVVDPYRRGPEAAVQAADRLDDLVRRIVPVLA